MKSLRKLGLTAVLALAAAAFVSTASASAFTKWQVDGVDVTSATNVAIATDPSGLTFKHFHGAAPDFEIKCQMTGGGTVNTGGAGTVTSLSSTSCVRVSGTCPTPISVTAVNLSWTTQISGSRLVITKAGSTPGVVITCGTSFTVTCTASSFSLALANGTGGVIGTADASTPTLTCNDGGTVVVTGNLVFSISGHALRVV